MVLSCLNKELMQGKRQKRIHPFPILSKIILLSAPYPAHIVFVRCIEMRSLYHSYSLTIGELYMRDDVSPAYENEANVTQREVSGLRILTGKGSFVSIYLY